MPYFVIGVGPNPNEIDWFGMTNSRHSREAHNWAIKHYQEDKGLPTSKQVYSITLVKDLTEERTEEIFQDLHEKYKET
jgi:hypothetical protein